VDDRQLGALIRSVRLRRGLRQADVAAVASVSPATVSLVERGHLDRLSLAMLRGVGAAVDVRVEVSGRWRGGNAGRLLSRRHSLLAESFAAFMSRQPGWVFEPEVSFSVYGERGIVDVLAWHEASSHVLVVELKTEFVDVNELLGTLDRKRRLAGSVSATRGWRPALVSAWLIVSDSRTNRRHARQHAALLRSRFKLDGRQLRPFLRDPSTPTSGMGFWTDSNPGSTSPGADRLRADRAGRHCDRPGPGPASGGS
jgi:transcriptional regulator with XRE-family HTH domain